VLAVLADQAMPVARHHLVGAPKTDHTRCSISRAWLCPIHPLPLAVERRHAKLRVARFLEWNVGIAVLGFTDMVLHVTLLYRHVVQDNNTHDEIAVVHPARCTPLDHVDPL
jgi:hypothetical protein